jgi:hypothetical protein
MCGVTAKSLAEVEQLVPHSLESMALAVSKVLERLGGVEPAASWLRAGLSYMVHNMAC